MASFFGLIKKVFDGGQSQANEQANKEAVQQDASTIVEAANATDLSEPQGVLEESVEPDLSRPRMIARTDRGRFVMEKAYTHLDQNRHVSSQEENESPSIDGLEIDKTSE
jgi:Holliday junction resolvasome RuvABC ATP-dependent DNA helicase subunit